MAIHSKMSGNLLTQHALNELFVAVKSPKYASDETLDGAYGVSSQMGVRVPQGFREAISRVCEALRLKNRRVQFGPDYSINRKKIFSVPHFPCAPFL